MTTTTLVKRIAFWLTIAFIALTLFAFTIGQFLPFEFKDPDYHRSFYDICFKYLPLAILLTLLGTIKKKNTTSKNWKIALLTIASSVISFFVLIILSFIIGFAGWTNEKTLYRSIKNTKVTICQQVYDEGALGTGGYRIVQLNPLLYYFQIASEIDTAKIDKTKWIYVKE